MSLAKLIDEKRPTLFLDEADGYILKENNYMLSVLNAGHARKGSIIRTASSARGNRVMRVFGLLPQSHCFQARAFEEDTRYASKPGHYFAHAAGRGWCCRTV